jgi:hypothetical protein
VHWDGSQIDSGGQTIDSGGLSVYDTMFLSSSNSNILTLYVTADDGSFVNSALLVNGDTVLWHHLIWFPTCVLAQHRSGLFSRRPLVTSS